jgi:hypothetical protein
VAWLAAVPAPPPDQIQRAADEVFARPEFAPDAAQVPWLLRVLTEFFRWLASLRAADPILYWSLLAGCFVLLVAVLAWVMYLVVRSIGFSDADARRRLERQAADRRGRLSATYRDEAGERAARGEFTEAIRYLFLSLVYRFDEKGRVALHKAYTNREYLALVADDAPVRSQLAVFVDTLDDHWYGQRPAGPDQYERCLGLYDRLAAV